MRRGILVFVLSQVLCLAQSTGAITGAVTDPSSAAVPDARVACKNLETGQETVVSTTSSGLFLIPDLPVGSYEVTVTKAGFQSAVRTGIRLLTGHTVDLPTTLRIGEISQSVTITSAAPLIQTTSSELQSTVDSRQMADLPLNGRNPFDLAVLSPGTITTGASTIPGQQDNTGLAVNGFLPTQNDWMLDGGSYNNLHFGSAPTLPNPDTLQEFTILTSNFSAENRGGGAVIKLTTRSGTNQLHGTLYEFFRNTKLDARNFFSASPDEYKQNQYGGTAGGPIRHDKLFFFGSYQGTNQRGTPSPELDTVPTAAQRAGDFSQTGKTIVDPVTGAPFAGNTIPQSRFDPIALKLLAFYKLPNYGTNGYINETVPGNHDDYQWMGKVDYYPGSKDTISGRYFWDSATLDRDEATMPGLLAHNNFRNQTVLVSDTHTFSPTWILHGWFNYLRTNRHEVPVSPTSMQDLGAQVQPAQDGVPKKIFVTMSGYTRLFTGRGIQFYPNVYEWGGDVSHAVGRHLLKFGGGLRRDSEYALNLADERGAWTFSAVRTSSTAIKGSGDAVASLLLGLPATFVQSTSNAQNFVLTIFDAWVQDDWRINRRLTFNLGLRWEPFLPPSDTNGPLTGFIPGARSTLAPRVPAGLVFSGDPGIPAAILHNYWGSFSPRFGFAWDVTGSSKLVVRGGYGVFRAGSEFFGMQRTFGNSVPGRSTSLSLTNPPSTGNPYAGYAGTIPFPSKPLTPGLLSSLTLASNFSLLAFDPSSEPQYAQSWNLTIERQLRSDAAIQVSYVGNHYVHGMMVYPDDPAIYGPGATTANTAARVRYPGFSNITFGTSAGHGTFHSLQAQFIKRAANGLTLSANYSYSKALDISSSGAQGAGGVNLRDPFDLNLDKGPADFDIRHQFKLAAVYQLPRLKSGSAGLRALANGWQINAITVARTGIPLTCKSGVDNSLSGVGNDNCDQVLADISRPAGADRVFQWFNTKAFSTNAIGTFGNAGRNIIRRPGQVNINASLFRMFPITERVKLEFRFEAFNLLNHPNFDLVFSNSGYVDSSNVSSPTFGQLIHADDPRLLQFALKLRF